MAYALGMPGTEDWTQEYCDQRNAEADAYEAEAPERAWKLVRAERNARLVACDWTLLADAPLTPEQKAAWATYRQALRDITLQADPNNITWPVVP